jgi:poly [ADP-ribose] polymerase
MVWIEDSGLIWDATLNQADSGKNNNKFYRVQLIVSPDEEEFVTWTRWGRVGEFGQYASLGHGPLEAAKAAFQRKFKDKSGLKWENRLDTPKQGKYTFIERNYEDDDSDDTVEKKESEDVQIKVESTLTKPLQNLMSFIFNPEHFQSAMASMSYDAQKLPLGKLSDRTLKTGFSILKELAELIAETTHDTNWQRSIESLSNRYFTTIPHVFGRHRPPVLNSDQLIKKEVELLDALTDMDVANEIMKDSKLSDVNELDRQFQGLGMKEMTRGRSIPVFLQAYTNPP